MRRNIEDYRRQEETLEQVAAPKPKAIEVHASVAPVQEETIQRSESVEPQKVAAQAETMPAVSESEVRSLSVRHDEAESVQPSEQLEGDSVIDGESQVDYIRQLVDEAYSSSGSINDEGLDAPVDELVAEFADFKDEPQDKDDEAYFGYMTTTNEVKDLMAEVEAVFEVAEQKILSELLIDMLATETYDISQSDEPPSLLFDGEGAAESLEVQSEVILNPLKKFTAYLENYEPDTRNQAIALMDAIFEAVNELKTDDHLSEEDKEHLLVEVEQTIRELLATLGHELEDERANKIIELLLITLDKERTTVAVHSIDYLNRMGTREYRPMNEGSSLDGLVQPTNSEPYYVELLGQYTIQASIA